MMNESDTKSKTIPAAWDDVRIFLAIVDYGSTHRAAQMLTLDHTTVGRRLRAFEQRLNVVLFERRRGRLELTPDGDAILAHARRMEVAARDLMAEAAQTGGLRGEVSLNVSEGLAGYWLIPSLQPFLGKHCEIAIRWQTMDQEYLVPGQQTDMAIWWWRPKDANLVQRKLGNVRFSLFTTRGYQERFGLPHSVDELDAHSFLQSDAYERNPAFARWNALVHRIGPSARLGNSTLTPSIIKGGRVIALLPEYVLLIMPELLVRVPVDVSVTLEAWLVYHQDQRAVPRIKALSDEIARLAKRDTGTWFS